MSRDYYKILNVSPDATPEEIRGAYRSLAFRYHPDRNPRPAAAWLMAAVNEAYEVLSDPRKRMAYDRGRIKKDSPLDAVVLRAARQMLLNNDWLFVREHQKEILLKHRKRSVQVFLTPEVNPANLNSYKQRAQCFSVVMALRITFPLDLTPSTLAVIDLVHSRVYGDFPDDAHRTLFRDFF